MPAGACLRQRTSGARWSSRRPSQLPSDSTRRHEPGSRSWMRKDAAVPACGARLASASKTVALLLLANPWPRRLSLEGRGSRRRGVKGRLGGGSPGFRRRTVTVDRARTTPDCCDPLAVHRHPGRRRTPDRVGLKSGAAPDSRSEVRCYAEVIRWPRHRRPAYQRSARTRRCAASARDRCSAP